ncbi:MAG: HAMP domain-containing histidine kinase [candidate division Zixibacteria bacterium]|nr:HAMP domain-containing histidine kinase [candidate division Zixibacteria bacterium]
MSSSFHEFISVYVLNALTAITLLFLYLLLSRTYYATKKDKGLFFLFGGLFWLLNLVYLALNELSKKYIGLVDTQEVGFTLSLNTVSMFFLLVAAKQRFFSKYPKLFNMWNIATISLSVLVLPIITLSYFPSHLRIVEVCAVSFGSLAIFLFGNAYQTYFWAARRPFRLWVKRCLVFSMYLYSLLQFGYLLKANQDIFFVAGTTLKLIHIFGLIGFSESLFADYKEKRLAYQKAKDAFKLADQLAHELNTPAAEMRLRLSALKSKYRVSSIVLEQERQLSNLVEQLTSLIAGYRSLQSDLDTQMIEKGPGTCNINTICDAAIMTLKLVMKPKVRFVKNYCSGPLVFGQESKFLQVFKNIFKNAIEATNNLQNPRIQVTTNVIKDSVHKPVQVQIKIEDTGPGIDERIFPKIFEDGISTKHSFGRGHGLYIAKTIIEEHRGTIQAKTKGNKPYTGAYFEITLPYFSKKRP